MDIPKVPSYFVSAQGDLLMITQVSIFVRPSYPIEDNIKIHYKCSKCYNAKLHWTLGAFYGLSQWITTKDRLGCREITEDQFTCATQFPV